MKALTICQPYAELIARGDKCVENRTWKCWHRGPLLIHAGKSRQWLAGDNYGIPLDNMSFGAIVARAEMVACLSPFDVRRAYPNLRGGIHIEGPYCFVLQNVRRLKLPVRCNGAQGLWDVPADVLAEVEEELRGVE